MAIDSAEKRRSAGTIVLPFPPGVTPNASKDSEWRAEAGWAYAGIPPGGPVTVAGVGIYKLHRGRGVSIGRSVRDLARPTGSRQVSDISNPEDVFE